MSNALTGTGQGVAFFTLAEGLPPVSAVKVGERATQRRNQGGWSLMTGNKVKVGRITVAIGLMLFGVALLADNLTGIQNYTSLVIRLWPLLLVGFGGEYLIRSIISSRPGAQEVRLRFDIGGAILLTLVVMLSVGVVSVRSWIANPGIASAFAFGPSISQTEQRTITAAGVKALQLDVPVGSLRLEPNVRSGEIRIEATRAVRGLLAGRGDSAQQLQQIKLDVVEGEIAKVRAEIPPGVNGASVSLVIYAPPDLKIEAETSAGLVQVRGYKGDMQLTSRVGRIEVEASSGSLSAANASGLISIRSFTGPVTAKTNVGAITLANQNGPLQLESGTGSINVNGFQGGKLVAENQMGAIHVATGTPLEGDVLLKSQTGQVQLSIPKESSIKVTAQIKSGSLAVPAFLSHSRAGAGETAVGSSGDGQHTVSLEASTGSVQLSVD